MIHLRLELWTKQQTRVKIDRSNRKSMPSNYREDQISQATTRNRQGDLIYKWSKQGRNKFSIY